MLYKDTSLYIKKKNIRQFSVFRFLFVSIGTKQAFVIIITYLYILKFTKTNTERERERERDARARALCGLLDTVGLLDIYF